MADKILDVAERLVQMHGFNGFSYADISDKLHIRKASLHYHFPSKADLGRKLITRYQEAFQQALKNIDEGEQDARQKLKQYAQLYVDVMRKKRMCLCGMLAADFTSLPKPMRDNVRSFFDANEAWLAKVLEEGRNTKVLRMGGPANLVARSLVSSLEGGMLVARSYEDVSWFESVAQRLLADLNAKA
jgi:TetR/AcrR family transcriptional repressor of nem operon